VFDSDFDDKEAFHVIDPFAILDGHKLYGVKFMGEDVGLYFLSYFPEISEYRLFDSFAKLLASYCGAIMVFEYADEDVPAVFVNH
jgi:hypothetical protein